MTETLSFIKALLIPNGRKPAGRRVWSIDLETVWLPFFTATNAVGDTHIAHDALGAPLRLAYASDGSVKFGKSGRPMTKVAKDLSEAVRMVRENFATGLQNYTAVVIADNADGYKAQVDLARQAGEPIIAKDKAKLDEAIASSMEQAIAEAEAKKAEATKQALAEAKAKAKAEAKAKKAKPKVEVEVEVEVEPILETVPV